MMEHGTWEELCNDAVNIFFSGRNFDIESSKFLFILNFDFFILNSRIVILFEFHFIFLIW
jgi:hypothetical protein